MIVLTLMSNDHHPDTKLTTYVRLKLESLALPFQVSGQMWLTVLQMIMSLALDPQSLPVILQLLSDENRSGIETICLETTQKRHCLCQEPQLLQPQLN